MIGVPMDFRLGFGKAFGEEAEIVVIDVAEPEREHPRPVAAELYGDLTTSLRALVGDGPDTSAWVERAARRSRPRSARPSASSSATRARRCTRCASTASSRRCSTATRS